MDVVKHTFKLEAISPIALPCYKVTVQTPKLLTLQQDTGSQNGIINIKSIVSH